MQPLVSVVIPVFNRECTIERAIDSVLRQTYKNLEIIVVDDCSFDGTKDKVKKYKEQRVRLLEQKKHGGAARARNIGIKVSKGEYIAFQDSDDEWTEDKLEKQIEYMTEKGFLISYCPYRLFEGNIVKIVPDIYEDDNLCSVNIIKSLRRGNIIGTPTLIFNRKVVSQIGYFDESLCALQDYEYAIRMAKEFSIGYIGVPLVNAYRMNTCISNNKDFLQSAQLKIIKKHADFIDLESMLSNYFETSEVFEKEIVQWDKLDNVINIIADDQAFIKKEELYRIAIEYIHNHYFRVKKSLVDRYKSFKTHLSNGEFVIYGAGYFGKKAYASLEKEGLLPQYFLVTERNVESNIDGIPIISIQEWNDREKPVVVAVSWEKQNEITDILINQNVFRFCIYPFC